MAKIGKPQKSKKHKKLKPVSAQYLDLWGDKKAKAKASNQEKQRQSQQVKINSKPQKPNDQEIPNSLKEIMLGKQKALMPKKKRKKKNKDLLTDSIFNDKPQKGMTRPVEHTPKFYRKKYESDRDFIQRVEVQCKTFVDRRKFEVTNEIIKPEDDPIHQDEKKDEEPQLKTEKKKTKKSMKEEQHVTKPVRLETVKSQPRSQARSKKEKLAKKKTATGFEKFTDKVKFGDIVMAPPTISAKPRGAQSASSSKKIPNLLLLDKLKKPDGKLDLTAKRKDLPLATRRKLDNERDKVVEMYREMKKRKIESR